MKQRNLVWFLFWGSLSTILYVFIGFPLLLGLRGLLRPRPVKRNPAYTPMVSMIIVAHNEAEVIKRKLDNAFTLDYPRTNLEIVVASDGSDDGTNDIVAQYDEPEVKLLALPRRGKNLTLNEAVTAAQGDILFFSDADSMLSPDALRHLVAPFSDAEVGGVGGNYIYDTDVVYGDGERTYWGIDRMWKRLQSQGGNMTSTTGQIYAIRRSLFKPVPPNVTDDFFTSVQVPTAHRRLVFEPRAVAHGPIADSAQGEFRRKVRIITRGLTSVWKNKQLLNPREYGFYAIQVFSHKLLRRLVAIPLLLTFVTAPMLWKQGWVYKLATTGQVCFHGFAVVGLLFQKTRMGRLKILSLPFYFDLIYAASAVALVNLVRGKQYTVWEAERSDME